VDFLSWIFYHFVNIARYFLIHGMINIIVWEYNVIVRLEDGMVYMIQKLILKNFFYVNNQTTGVAEE
jgi:hypothetical protein